MSALTDELDAIKDEAHTYFAQFAGEPMNNNQRRYYAGVRKGMQDVEKRIRVAIEADAKG